MMGCGQVTALPEARPMSTPTSSGPRVVRDAARTHGFSEAAVRHLLDALQKGGGRMAQFDHAEFGGSGQWMSGGMLMLSTPFDHALKARVAALAESLAAQASAAPATGGRDVSLVVPACGTPAGSWWPAHLPPPSSTGSQNDVRYASFPAVRRLVVDTGGRVTVYDTGDHRIQGVSQQQSRGASLTFTSQHGVVRLADLPVVDEVAAPEPPPAAAVPASAPTHAPASAPATPTSSADPLSLIARLAELKAQGILSEDEFAAKKADLLARL